ncbi:MAG: hypothetical protein WC724_03765 [Candidatus Paceibacterota bacterium]
MTDVYSFLDKSLYKLTPQKEASSSVVDPSNIDSGLSTGFSEMVSGGIKQGKHYFDNTETGFILGIDDDLAKFYIGDTSNYLNWTGTQLIISGNITATSGTIGGWTIGATSLSSPSSSFSIGSGNSIFKADSNGIYLGNATFADATFSVDMTGNTNVSSLKRDDFHWFTPFESIDGYTKPADGTGSNTLSEKVILTTGTSNNDTNYFIKEVMTATSSNFSWDKKGSGKFCISLQGTVTNTQLWIVRGSLVAIESKHIGFRVEDGVVAGFVGNGTNYASVDLGTTLVANDIDILEYRLNPDVGSVSFYINGVLKGSISQYVPTGAGSPSNFLINLTWLNYTGAAKVMWLNWIDFWQAN